MFGKIKNFLMRNKVINEVMTDFGYRTVFISLLLFAAGIAYAAFNLAVGVIYGSAWYFALAFYYAMLCIIRGGILIDRYRCAKLPEEERFRRGMKQNVVCGSLFIVMTLFLSVMVTLIAFSDKTFHYSVTVIYMAAGYTFYRISVSAYNFIRAGRQRDYTSRTLHCVNLAAALVSFLSLQSAALTAFSQYADQIIMNVLTGGIVCAVIIVMGILMISGAKIKLRNRFGKLPSVDFAADV